MVNGAIGVIFRRSLLDSRRGILGWGALLGGMGFWFVAMFPAIEDLIAVWGSLLEQPAIKALVGDVEVFASLEGFISIKFLAMLPLILAVYIVLSALGIVASEEEKGTLDILLSTPAPRWQIVGEKFAALAVALAVILGFQVVGLLGGSLTLGDKGLALGQSLAAALNMLPVCLLIGALTLMLTTVVRSRNQAAGLSAGIVVGSYFMMTLADLAGERFAIFRQLSFYHYYNGDAVLNNGIVWGDFALLLALAAALFGLSLVFFQRRDLGV